MPPPPRSLANRPAMSTAPSAPLHRSAPQQMTYTAQPPSQYVPSQTRYQSPAPQSYQSQQYEYDESQSFQESQPPWGSSQQSQRVSTQINRPVDQCRPDSYRSVPDAYSRAAIPPPGAKTGTKASEVLLGKMAELDAKLDTNNERLTSIRDIVHDVRTSLHAIPTRRQVKEDIEDIVAPALLEFQTNVINHVQEALRRVPDESAIKAADKLRPMLNSSVGSSTEKQLSTLMDHLLASLRPVDELKTTLTHLRGIPQALQSIGVFQQGLEQLHAKVDIVARRSETLPTPVIDERILNTVHQIERRMNLIDRRIDQLATDATVKGMHKDVEAVRDRPSPSPIDVGALATALHNLAAASEQSRPAPTVDVCALATALHDLQAKKQAEKKIIYWQPTGAPPTPQVSQQAPPAATPTPHQPPVLPRRSNDGRFLKRTAGQQKEVTSCSSSARTPAVRKRTKTVRRRVQATARPQQPPAASAVTHPSPSPAKKHKTTAPTLPEFVRRSERRRAEPQRFGQYSQLDIKPDLDDDCSPALVPDSQEPNTQHEVQEDTELANLLIALSSSQPTIPPQSSPASRVPDSWQSRDSQPLHAAL